MSHDVDGIRFTFGASWKAVQWDETQAFRKGIQRLQNTKAVDLIAMRPDVVGLIEVKDFRHDPKTDWPRVTSGSLVEEVAHKVRDTLAGILAAARPDAATWDPWVDCLRKQRDLKVIVWLERPNDYYGDPRRADELQHFRDKLKQRLSWLTSNIFIASRRETIRLDDVTAVDL